MSKSALARLALLLPIALVIPSLPALAFGPDGHRVVGELAQRQLAPAALTEVRRLLGGEADAGLASVSNWADEIRDQPAWRHTSRWHYLNFPRGSCRYDAERDCRDDRCIVAAINAQAALLADRSLDDEQRAQALRFLVHFVGDIHQPLHAGYGDDRGGNTFQIFYIGRGSNLHALWDGGILRSAGHDWTTQATRLADRAAGVDVRWSLQAPARWAEESCRLIGDAGLYPPRPGRLPDGYVERQYPVLEQRLVIAASRLSAMLNHILSPPEPTH